MRKIAIIKSGKFAIVKSKKEIAGAFANIIDDNEITSIISEDKVSVKDIIDIEKGYRLISFDMVLPFDLVGFIANVSNALAKEKIPIFVISSYSTDHILVQEKYIEKAKNKLKELGFELK